MSGAFLFGQLGASVLQPLATCHRLCPWRSLGTVIYCYERAIRRVETVKGSTRGRQKQVLSSNYSGSNATPLLSRHPGRHRAVRTTQTGVKTRETLRRSGRARASFQKRLFDARPASKTGWTYAALTTAEARIMVFEAGRAQRATPSPARRPGDAEEGPTRGGRNRSGRPAGGRRGDAGRSTCRSGARAATRPRATPPSSTPRRPSPPSRREEVASSTDSAGP